MYPGVVVGLLAAKIVLDVTRDLGADRSPAGLPLLVGLGAGTVAGSAAVILIVLSWRRWGGPRLVRAGRRAWRTGSLPCDLPLRLAVLHDLERRERDLDRHAPRIVIAVAWTLFGAVQLWRDPSPLTVVAWVAFIVGMALIAALDLADRRRRSELRALIGAIRADPTGHGG